MSALIAAIASLIMGTSNDYCDPCYISDGGLAHVRSYEGYSAFIYKDIAGKETIGFGHLVRPGETFEQPLTPQAADALLRKDVAEHEGYVRRYVKVPILQNQFDALTSWTFNLGPANLKSSTMLKRVNAALHDLVPAQIMRWNKARVNGVLKEVWGLTRRRKSEAKMYAG